MHTKHDEGLLMTALENELKKRAKEIIEKHAAAAGEEMRKILHEQLGQIVIGLSKHYSFETRGENIVITVHNKLPNP